MPQGGDVTGFSIGLMSCLQQAYHQVRLPLWNNLWGFGFPGLAESQMGVYYPPHLLLYGLLPLEWAYTASLVLHTVWGGLGAWWAARRFGASSAGGAFGALAWAASGFFVIHLPHQWAATLGSWMPWAVGLAWQALGQGPRCRSALLLAGVLALQILPGHFQLAFQTQVAVLGLALWRLVDRSRGDAGGVRGPFLVVGAWALALLLAWCQLGPTAQLAAIARGQRGWEYLSGFAASPLHLVSYVVPGLMHRSPLWRPLAWDPFHTSPEEHAAYIGLAPLLMAVLALRHQWRDTPAVRALGWLAVLSLFLSLGPYAPGFSLLIQLPGFSSFRAPARWGVLTELCLALLAARGLDRILAAGWGRAAAGCGRLAILVTAVSALVIGGFEVALAATGRPALPALRAMFDRVGGLLPWEGDPDCAAVLAAARRPPRDTLVQRGLMRQGIDPFGARFAQSRGTIYLKEVGPSLAVAVALALVAWRVREPRRLAAGLALITLADLLMVSHLDRTIEDGPLSPLTRQSAVLAALESDPANPARPVDEPPSRVLNTLGNLVMVARVGTLPAYRTLDRPVAEGLLSLALAVPGPPPAADPEVVAAAMRLVGAGVRVFEPYEPVPPEALRAGWPGTWQAIRDPALAGWLYGPAWVERAGTRLPPFWLWRLDGAPGMAVVLGGPKGTLPDADPTTAAALPRVVQLTPERLQINGSSSAAPAALRLSQLDDPLWEARGEDGRPLAIAPVQPGGREEVGAWQQVSVDRPGEFTIALRYRPRNAIRALAISGVAWIAWCMAYLGSAWADRGKARAGVEP